VNNRAETGPREPFWTRRRIQIGVGLLVVLVVAVLLATSRGCKPPSRTSTGTAQDERKEADQRNQLFDTAWALLQQPEIFDGMFEGDEEIDPALDRLNQWLQAQQPPDDWRVDPLAAPLLKSLASLVELVRPVDAALTQPGNVLELKELARRFEAPAARLKQLAQRRSLQDLDRLDRQFEQSVKQIDDTARQIADALREARESNRNPSGVSPRSGAGASDVEADLRRYEAQLLDQLSRRLRDDPAKRATFDQLYELARQLDYAGRLREAKSLWAFAQSLEEFAAKHDRQEVEALVLQYEEVVSRYAELLNKTRLSTQLRFILNQLDQAAQMKDLAEWKVLQQVVGEVAEGLKIAARRTGRGEIRELAAQVDEARNKRDIPALNAAAAQLAAMVRPTSIDELADSARQLEDRSALLVKLAAELGRLAKQNQSENLQGLSEFAGQLAAQVQSAAKALRSPPQTSDPQKRDAELDSFTTQYAVLTARVKQLAEDLDYFATLGALDFPTADRNTVREAILLRDLSRWVRGEDVDDVSRAKRLFDWVVRNVQLEPDAAQREGQPGPRFMKRPWETLLWGVGTAMERAWVFILLARQQGLDAAVLALEDPADPAHQRLRPWVVAVLSEGNPYLFDPYLGLPIPGPGGIKLSGSGPLDVQPATLAQVLDDERLLRQMDLGGGRPYWVKASELKKVVAFAEGSPPYLAQRMRLIESGVAGEDRAVLSAAPAEQAKRLKASRGITEVRLWPRPYETLFQRTRIGDQGFRQVGAALQQVSSGALWKGRVRHLEGKFTGDRNAVQFYGKARPSDLEILSLSAAAAKVQEGRRGKPAASREAELLAASIANRRATAVLAKQNASYWLGLAAFEQGNYPMAIDYFTTKTLDPYPDGPWTAGTRYNLGRVYEAQKNYPRAIEHYRGNTRSAQSVGEQLRAQWLEKLTVVELPGLPGLPGEKQGADKERPSKKGPAKKEKAALPDLPPLPGLPEEKESSKKPEKGKST